MIDLYSKPRTIESFHEYISILRNGNKGDMVSPIVGFNPMAKDHVVQKLQELKDINAEELMLELINSINKWLAPENSKEEILVVLNLADDLHGAWTNRHTTDYDSKFRIQAFVSRGFCAPHF